jgi:hypothetical protein
MSAQPALLHITAEMLEAKGAWCDQVALFKRTFPRGLKPTLRNLAKARSVGLGFGYIAEFLNYAHRAAYYAAIAPHRAAYYAAIAPHRAAYYAACAPHEAAYEAARDASLSAAFAAQGVA